ncbi:MAG: MBL fold metallo-hydrolase [Frankiaceae bacterium]|nr:MBL fold metallo-hydrolase [Frankiaceae bacterium]MBV9871336.1 MBL fold metallo-hydrolase [Frankiaceae bacterium]
MKLTIIGSAGTFPGPASGCSSYLLEQDGFRLLLDVGNGSTGALQEACGLLGPDAVVVSHLHGDHYLDLITYTYARRYHPDGTPPLLPVYGPSQIQQAMIGAYGKGIDSLLSEVYDFHAIDRNQTVPIGPFEVDLRRVNHPVETYAMRISADGRALTYSADTGVCDTLVELARDVDLFLCEASYLDGDPNPPNIHLTGREAAEHATKAAAQRLLLTHLVPWGDEARTVAEAKSAYDGEIAVARSLDVHEV